MAEVMYGVKKEMRKLKILFEMISDIREDLLVKKAHQLLAVANAIHFARYRVG